MRIAPFLAASTLLVAFGVIAEPPAPENGLDWTHTGLDTLATALQEARGSSRRLLIGIGGSPG